MGSGGDQRPKPCRSKKYILQHFFNLNFAEKVGNRGNVDSVPDFTENTAQKLKSTEVEL